MSEDPEVLRQAGDKVIGGLPREPHRRRSGAPGRPPALWTAPETVAYEGEIGAYPKGFIRWACRQLGCAPHQVLHVCSGAIPAGHGLRVDLRRSCAPDLVADGRALPLRSSSVRGVLVDPPYTVEYARELYDVDYPRPSHLLAEASRVVEPCGRIGILHFLVPMPPPCCKLVGVRGVTTGCGYRIRAFTIFERAQDGLFDGGPS